MTYCVGMQLDAGLIFMSDTRTNAGVDNISVFRKMVSWEVPGERVITLLTAGNLATTQSVISQLEERRIVEVIVMIVREDHGLNRREFLD